MKGKDELLVLHVPPAWGSSRRKGVALELCFLRTRHSRATKAFPLSALSRLHFQCYHSSFEGRHLVKDGPVNKWVSLSFHSTSSLPLGWGNIRRCLTPSSSYPGTSNSLCSGITPGWFSLDNSKHSKLPQFLREIKKTPLNIWHILAALTCIFMGQVKLLT